MKSYQVYTVGGAVRDKLLGLDPKDYDYVVVGATPQQMLDMGFQQVGADFPVFLNERGEEFALARTERKTGAGYLGFATETDGVTLTDDLMRRDLTINAMAMADDGTIMDPFNGQRDLQQKVLRHVSPAFAEDPLRVVRLARFYSRYSDFSVAQKTRLLASALVERGSLNELAMERFWAELKKVFEEKRPDRFFQFLHMIDADSERGIKFFKLVYGRIDIVVTSLAEYLANMDMPAEERAMFHAAMCSIELESKLSGVKADTRTMALAKNFHSFASFNLTIDFNVDALFDLLKQAKAWGSGSAVADLVTAVRISTDLKCKPAITADQLVEAVEVTKVITAEQFPDMPQGKELGQAIEAARKVALCKLLDLPDTKTVRKVDV